MAKRYALAVALVLAGSMALRLVGLGWGLPHYDPRVLAHSLDRPTYHLDEDNFLWGQVNPTSAAFEIHDFHWGTLQFLLISGVLWLGQAVGVVHAPWQSAFVLGDASALPQIYMLGRLVSTAAGVAATGVVIALGQAVGGRCAGIGAGIAYALAPLAVVEAHYLTNDLTMSALVAGCVLAAVWAMGPGGRWGLVLAGLLLGLATATKYSAIFAAPALLPAQWALWRGSRADEGGRSTAWTVLPLPWAAAALGFLLGEPYAVTAPGSVLAGIRSAAEANLVGTANWRAPLGMLRLQAQALGTLGLTWPLALLALCGLVLLLAALRPSRKGTRVPASPPPTGERLRARKAVLLAAVAGLVVSVAVNSVFMLRYDQPLVPLLAVAVGVGWAAIPWAWGRVVAGGLAVAWAGAITLGQLALMTEAHPANELQTWVLAQIAPGTQVARTWREYPPLDDARYPQVHLDPWLPDLAPDQSPDYIIMDDMQYGPPTPRLAARLARDYTQVARFSAQPHIGSFSWSEGSTPHDWKYSHPSFVVYRRVGSGQ